MEIQSIFLVKEFNIYKKKYYMKNLKTFESFKINELQDMFTLPIDVVEQTGKELDKIRNYFNDFVSEIEYEVERNLTLTQRDFKGLQEFCRTYFGGIEPQLNFATIKKMTMELNKHYHEGTNENVEDKKEEEEEEGDSFATRMAKKEIRRRLKKAGMTDEEIEKEHPSLKIKRVKFKFSRFIKKLFRSLTTPSQIGIWILSFYSQYISNITGENFFWVFFKNVGYLAISFFLAVLVAVIYRLLKGRQSQN